jgi:hypothetical protein
MRPRRRDTRVVTCIKRIHISKQDFAYSVVMGEARLGSNMENHSLVSIPMSHHRRGYHRGEQFTPVETVRSHCPDRYKDTLLRIMIPLIDSPSSIRSLIPLEGFQELCSLS